MKQKQFLLITAAILVTSAFTLKTNGDWKIKDGYSIKFTSKDPTGIFKKMQGSINFDENNLKNSQFDVSVDVNSINTGKGMQNKHAVSNKWFDAEKYPLIKFKSSAITKTKSGFSAKGIMEIKGIKKNFDIPFTFQNNVFRGSFHINRIDFGIGSQHKVVPDSLKVDISVPVTR